MNEFEKLGVFYLGKNYDTNSKKISNEYILYDSKDLTTHAVCVGMTGSGKTGLCISLLEEAAIDNVPAIVIDPKGDITNLLLTFPQLNGEDFLPWINKSDASRKNMTEEEFANSQAELWKKGLKEWDQDSERIAMMKEKSEFNIYTPGSNAGIQISILDSFKAPPDEVIEDTDIFSDKISSTASSLLGLLGIDADPIKSKEHILLSNVLQHYWANGEDLDLPKIIQNIQAPPFNKIGVFEIESFYPEKDRFTLAMQLNNILSAPGFQSWLNGESLDIDKLLYNESGKPRISIFYTAHLSDSERMFFTSLLLNQTLSWMRKQSGTTSLRALLYVDEIFGYLPPVSNPPTKIAFLTLLKQARAFGLGLVLATQNPVDLDYKSLSNAGTWFIGRLQTERDQKRILDGLEGASLEGGGKFNRSEIEKLLANLDKRVFLLHNVHEEHPQIFHTRWAMSYLRGPLTRTQIKTLVKAPVKPIEIIEQSQSKTSSTQVVASLLPKEIKPLYMNRNINESEIGSYSYKPFVIAMADIRFSDKPKKIDLVKSVSFIAPITENIIAVNWDEATEIKPNENIFSKKSAGNINFANVPNAGSNPKNYSKWQQFFEDNIVNDYYLEIYHSPELKETSNPYENVRDFKIRLSQLTREQRDDALQKVKDKYARRIQTLEGRIQRAQEKIEREKSQSSQQKLSTAISIGSTILGALFGRKTISATTISKAGTAIKSAGKIAKESSDVSRAEESLVTLNEQMTELQDKMQDDINQLEDKFDLSVEQLEVVKVRPTKSNISVKIFSFLWIPTSNETIDQIEEIELV
ncbi:MAG: ATP-binding protein [Ignavibacteriales bacterium]|nr:ATP-binding protein [Ignavibacteriales bacterium]MCB9210731.1 ATP-binding protein [Ignavibacteriales bacterium]MCB9219232.1 ATP-binding protein [Ignavibacteriales bacterium]MCB9260125.1 ATP-binding protein [Ignavibacteriales bacterium]